MSFLSWFFCSILYYLLSYILTPQPRKKWIWQHGISALVLGLLLSFLPTPIRWIAIGITVLSLRLAIDDAKTKSICHLHVVLFIIASLGSVYIEQTYFYLVVGILWGLIFFIVHLFFSNALGSGDIYFAIGSGCLLGPTYTTWSFLLASLVALLHWYYRGAHRYDTIPLLAYWAPATCLLWLGSYFI